MPAITELPSLHNQDSLGSGQPVLIDIEGGDHVPDFGISAAHLLQGAERAKQSGINVVVVGLAETLASTELPFYVADSVVPMGEGKKREEMRNPTHSVNVAARLVKAGEASGFASTCDTAAMVGAAALELKRYAPSLKTPLAAVLPRSLKVEGETILLDAGAAPADISGEDLALHGLMGAVYAGVLLGRKPIIALLANGTEPTKGLKATHEAQQLLEGFKASGLSMADAFDLINGFMEPKELFFDGPDVAITDGYTGNHILKTAEGAVRAVMESLPTRMRNNDVPDEIVELTKNRGIYSLAEVFDPNQAGGAAILGVRGNALVLHGSSNGTATERAAAKLANLADANFQTDLAQAIAAFKEFKKTLTKNETESDSNHAAE